MINVLSGFPEFKICSLVSLISSLVSNDSQVSRCFKGDFFLLAISDFSCNANREILSKIFKVEHADNRDVFTFRFSFLNKSGHWIGVGCFGQSSSRFRSITSDTETLPHPCGPHRRHPLFVRRQVLTRSGFRSRPPFPLLVICFTPESSQIAIFHGWLGSFFSIRRTHDILARSRRT